MGSTALRVVGSGDAVTERLQAGRIRLAPNTPEGALADRAAGGSLIVIGGLTNRLPFRLIGLPGHEGLESLRGGTICVSSLTEGTVHVIEAMLATVGLRQPDDYTLEVVGAHARHGRLADGAPLDPDAYLDLSYLKRAHA